MDNHNTRIGTPAGILLLAASYAAAGWLTHQFNPAAEYGVPIWLPAGIALAALLLGGRRLWPGVWAGCWLVTAYRLAGTSAPASVALSATVIAAGATVQALIGHALVAAGQAEGAQLDTFHSARRFVLLAGLTACLVGATTGAATLLATHQVGPRVLFDNWFSWWVGDALGVILGAPVMLAACARSSTLWRARRATVAAPLLVCAGLAWVAFSFTAWLDRERSQAEFGRHATLLAGAVRKAFDDGGDVSRTLADFLRSSKGSGRREFDEFAAALYSRHPGLQALEWIPHVSAERLADHERATRAAGFGSYAVVEKDAAGKRIPAGPRAEYFPVHFIYPLAGNEPALGYDLASEPIRRSTMAEARRSHALAVSPRVKLIQETAQQYGVLAFEALFQPGLATPDGLQGYTLSVIRVEQLADAALARLPRANVVFRIDDLDAAPGEQFLAGEARLDQAASWTSNTTFEFGGRRWRLTFAPTPDYVQLHRAWYIWLVYAGTLVLASLLALFLLILTGRANRVENLVAARTADLQDRNAQLDAVFALCPDGFVAFDADRHVRFVNPAFLAMTGLDAADVIDRHESALDEQLRRRVDAPERFQGVASYFAGDEALPPFLRLGLQSPRPAVLQLVGIRSRSPSLPRILYLRDITLEAKVERLKSEFLSQAAHELRTPMTSIFGFSELLLQRELPEATRRNVLETIHRQTRWLVDVVNELLDLARIESGGGKNLNVGEMDLAALVRETVDGLSFDPARWPVSVDLPAGPLRITADAAKVRQALTNVLGNAQKYSPDGGAIGVTGRSVPGRIGIAVADRGIGMSPEQVARVGERLWRADPGTRTPGTGLGMAIVREILKLHGGSVEIESQPGAGTTVTLWWTLEKRLDQGVHVDGGTQPGADEERAE